jgi:hypothetical protein
LCFPGRCSTPSTFCFSIWSPIYAWVVGITGGSTMPRFSLVEMGPYRLFAQAGSNLPVSISWLSKIAVWKLREQSTVELWMCVEFGPILRHMEEVTMTMSKLNTYYMQPCCHQLHHWWPELSNAQNLSTVKILAILLLNVVIFFKGNKL